MRVAPLVPQRVIGDGVDGEVAAGEILVERSAVLDHGMAPVGADVAPEGGDLVHHVRPVDHADRAVLHPDRRGAPEEPLHILRPRRGGEVEIGVRIAEEGVPQRAADAPRFVARVLQHTGDLHDLLGHRYGRGEAHGDPYGTPAESAMTSSMRACDGVRGPAGIAPIAVVRAPPPSNA